MASGTPIPVRSRGIKLSSIHAGKRRYPKAHSRLDSDDFIFPMFSSFSPTDTLPEHTSPTHPTPHRPRSLTSLFLSRDGSPSRTLWVAVWFTLNFSLTISNKIVLNQFPFPHTMTALHALAGCIGSWFVMSPEDRIPTLSTSEIVTLVSFSTLYTLNIIVSNVSLQLVTVPFHQVVRSSAPFFTLILAALLIQSRITPSKLISLVPVVAGVGLATYGDYYYTLSGFLLTLLGTFLAALKTVVTNILQSPYPPCQSVPTTVDSLGDQWDEKNTSQSRHLHSHSFPSRPRVRTSNSPTSRAFTYPTSLISQYPTRTVFPSLSSIPRLHLSPIQLLHLLSPLALFQCILLAIYFNEHIKILSYFYHFTHSGNHTSFHGPDSIDKTLNGTGIGFTFASGSMSAGSGAHGILPAGLNLHGALGLIINASMAFALNVVSFNTNRIVGPLGMSVAANVKQVLTILSSVVLFNLTITGMNALGVTLTLIGGAWYAHVDLRERGIGFHWRQ